MPKAQKPKELKRGLARGYSIFAEPANPSGGPYLAVYGNVESPAQVDELIAWLQRARPWMEAK